MKADKEKNFVSAVIYVRNDADRIAAFIQNLYQLLDKNFTDYEIICVNDQSTDSSMESIKSAYNREGGAPLTLINMGFYHGTELAMNAGVDLAIGDFVFEFDSALMDYEPELIMDVYRHSLTGFDIVGAAPKHHIARSSRWFYRLFNRHFEGPNALRTERFRILSRRAINRVHAISKTIPYRKAIYAGCGLKLDVLEYDNSLASQGSRQKDENGIRQSVAVDSLMLFTNVAFKLSMMMTFLMIGTTVIMAVYALVYYIAGNTIEGWTTTVLFLSFGFFGVFAVLAIVIKYLSLILDLTFKKEKYFVMSVEKLTK